MPRAKQPSDVNAAVEEWIAKLRVPQVAQDSVRAKFKRMKLTADEVRTDMRAKLARENTAK